VEQLVNQPRLRNRLDQLSSREREVLALMAEGRSNQAISQQLVLGDRTVETHVRNIFAKLELPASGDDHRRVLAVLSYLRA
jgi:DNA-binding NarL/FixJ family response regulator